MSVQELLLDALEELIDSEFDTFKWYLSLGNVEGRKPFKKAQLQKAKRHKTVSKMKDRYGEDLAVSVTLEVLKKMGKNGNAEDLKRHYEATGRTVATGSTSSSAAAPAAAPAGLMAQGGSVIVAPSFSQTLSPSFSSSFSQTSQTSQTFSPTISQTFSPTISQTFSPSITVTGNYGTWTITDNK